MELAISRESNSDLSSAQLRQRACIPCTKAKRRCDKSRPFCQRCLDKEAPCQYSASRPYARRGIKAPKASGVTATEPAPLLDFPPSALFDGDDDDCDGNYGGEIYMHHKGADTINLPSPASWFLQVEHWVIHHSYIPPHPLPIVRNTAIQQFIRCLRKWCQQWVECGHCPMIHRALFANTGMPPCLQDAYAALAVYSFKNEHNEDMVMQHIEDKANALIEEHSTDEDLLAGAFVSATPLSTIQHLTRVLSLFIYQFIRLFDGHIRQRAQAEKQIPLLKSWTEQLWSSVNIDVTVQNAFGGDYLVAQDNADATTKLWHIWILMENVRRIWMVSTYTRCIYLVSRDGSIDCEGIIDFTARRGLWDASSAALWRHVLEQKDPLLVMPFQAAGLFDTETAEDIDVFGLAAMSLSLDSDQIDSWVANSTGMKLETLLMAA